MEIVRSALGDVASRMILARLMMRGESGLSDLVDLDWITEVVADGSSGHAEQGDRPALSRNPGRQLCGNE